MLLFSNAKINLGLHVVEKRSDGFHNIETAFMPIGWSDVVEVVPSDTGTVVLHNYGLQVDAPAETNLCVKAYRMLEQDFDLPGAEIHLYKHVPFGAGLGGGSSNAAFTLVAANRVFSLGLSAEALVAYAARLGSDCAFFVHNRPMLATGRGEILRPIDLSLEGYKMLVLKPAVSVSTADAYGSIVPRKPLHSLEYVLQQDITQWRELLVNDFEASVFARYPSLAHIKQWLYGQGAIYAAMSGSGSSLFGIFAQGCHYQLEQIAQQYEGMVTHEMDCKAPGTAD